MSRSPGRSPSQLLVPLLVLFLSGLVILPAAAQPAGLPLEAFSSTDIPAGWSVENAPGAVPVGWRLDNPARRDNRTGGAGAFIIADSDYEGPDAVMDTRLSTPVLNLTGVSTVQLRFKTFFEALDDSSGDVDVSTDGGQSWTTVERYTGFNVEGTISLNLSEQVRNQPRVLISFRYRGTYAYQWQLDDVEVLAGGPPAAPTGLAASAAADVNRVELRWTDASTSESAFQIERSPSGNGGWAEIATVPADTTGYSDQNVGCGATYFYRVRAASAAGRSDYSNVGNAATLACPALATLSESFSGGGLPAGWSNVDYADQPSGRVWRFDDPAGRNNRIGTGGFAVADSGYFGGPTVAALRTPPVNLSNAPFVELSFNSFFRRYDNADVRAAEEDVAQIYVSVDGGQGFQQSWGVPSSFAGTRALDLSDLAGGRSNVVIDFYYRADNDYFWMIDDVQLRPMPLPPAPGNLSATLGADNQVNLAWNTSGAASYVTYEVERRIGGSSQWVRVNQGPVSGGVFADESLKTRGSNYFYRVRAVNRAGSSSYTAEASITVPGDPAVSAQTIDVTVSYYEDPGATKRTAIREVLEHFADAIYEMSNGVHRLGKVTIYPNHGLADRADIVWVQRCSPPNAPLSGRALASGPNKRVEFCDLWVDSQGNVLDDHLGASKREGGYTLGHEFGHYFYSVLDEYRNANLPCNSSGWRINNPCADDRAVPFSVMSESFNAAFLNDYRYLNFSYAGTNTGSNAQHRLYGASAWETLARPLSEDPRDGARSSQPQRIYYPELAAVAPGQGDAPTLQLPALQAAARAALRVIYAENPTPAQVAAGLQSLAAPSGVVRQLVIDASSREANGASDLEAFKAAARRLVDRADLGDALGVISYAGAVTVRLAPTVIAGDADRAALKAAIDSIQPGNAEAATGPALQRALDDLATFGEEASRAVYLITGGPQTTGAAPFSLVGAYQTAGVKLFTLGYVTDERVTAELQELAAQTGGEFTYIDGSDGEGTTTRDLLGALAAHDQAIIPQTHVTLKAGSASADAGSVFTIPIVADASLVELELEISHRGALSDLGVTLLDPAGASRPVPCGEEVSTEYPEVICYLKLAASPGTWQLRLQAAQGLSLPFDYAIAGASRQDAAAMAAGVAAVEGETVSYPEPIVIAAAVGKDLPITGARVIGTVEAPDGAVFTVRLLDDGVAPDEVAKDGVYSGIVRYNLDGTYKVTVSFDNSSGAAQYTNLGTEAHTGQEPTLTPVGQNFERITSFQITASGYETDDHQGWPEEATLLTPDNTDVSGQIDYAGDVDAFRVTVPAGYSGKLIVRVAGLGFDMDPFVYITDSIFSFTRLGYFNYVPSGDEYLTIPIQASPGQELYIYLLHYTESAETGVYQISVGPQLVREQASAVARVEPLVSPKAYLPMASR